MILAHFDVFGSAVFYLVGGVVMLVVVVLQAVIDRLRGRREDQ
jgi:hypothetical protein